MTASSPSQPPPAATDAAPASALSPQRAARRRQLVANLRDPIVVVEDAHQLQEWGEGAYRQFRPVNAWQDWLVQQIGLTTFRVNRIQRVERRLRDLQSLRAIDCWDEDRRVEVEEMAAKHFDREPEHTVCRLLASPAGCDWLIARWEALAPVDPAAWTAQQKALATHLNRGRPADWSPALIADRVAGLRDHRARLADQDALARTLAESNLSEELSPALRRVRRHEKELLTRLKWFIRHAQAKPEDRWLDERYRPSFTSLKVEPIPAPTPEPGEIPSPPAPADEQDDPNGPQDAASVQGETNPPNSYAGEHVNVAGDQTNPDCGSVPASYPPPAADAVADDRADRAEARTRRPDPARLVAQARRSRRRTA